MYGPTGRDHGLAAVETGCQEEVAMVGLGEMTVD